MSRLGSLSLSITAASVLVLWGLRARASQSWLGASETQYATRGDAQHR